MLSAPCSCLTVVAAEVTWTEVGAAAVTGGDGEAETDGHAPGSVLTVTAESRSIRLQQKIRSRPSQGGKGNMK